MLQEFESNRVVCTFSYKLTSLRPDGIVTIGLTEASVEHSAAISMSEEELAIMQMALMRGMNSSNHYFKERCEELLYRILDDLSNTR